MMQKPRSTIVISGRSRKENFLLFSLENSWLIPLTLIILILISLMLMY